ncbi:hypothetical protein FC35_GL000014 [Limosilactobacillus coleohominis DSM 14060]|nr:hypothetical protein FC35_GL000014 [Limosilactobacillus coleohominis DSM 14060]
MKLVRFQINNFRGYENAELNVGSFSTIVGKNDAGKSALLEALNIFFNKKLKLSPFDFNVNNQEGSVVFTGIFKDLPKRISLETIDTNFEDERLLNKNNELELIVEFDKENSKRKEYLVSYLPKDKKFDNIHAKKITSLRNEFRNLISDNDVDARKSSSIRKVAFDAYDGEWKEKLVNLNSPKEDMKSIVEVIHKYLPVFQIFKSDRDNSDKDSEVQDPVKAIINTALANKNIADSLDQVQEAVNSAIEIGIADTKKKMNEVSPNIADSINIESEQLKWDKVFNFKVFTKNNIPLENRGSGFRRLMLLSFFRSEAQKEINSQSRDIIYAFEEPETAQHPNNQTKIVETFLDISKKDNVQIMITTHSPSIAMKVPTKYTSLVYKDDNDNSCIENDENTLDKVVKELGIISDIKLYPDQIKTIVFVEGPDDADFFESVYKLMFNDEYLSRSGTVLIPSGGSVIKDMVNSNFVGYLNPDNEIAIVDGDKAGSNYKTTFESKNIKVEKLRFTTIECYLSWEYIQNIFANADDQIRSKLPQIEADQWNLGQQKLDSKIKRFLKRKKAYTVRSLDDLNPKGIEELKIVLNQIKVG